MMKIPSLVLLGLCSCVSVRGESGSRDPAPSIHELPVSPQQGPSCAFFANLPIVAWATGYDVGTSPAFVRSVYGLRRGDFAFERAFDKRIFCELFGFRHELVEIEHPPAVERELLPAAERIVVRHFDKELAKGWVFSLRVKGLMGGPHNALLLGKLGEDYLVHDPRGGRMRQLSRRQLAGMILVESSRQGRSLKPSHVTHYLKVQVPLSPVARVLPAGDFARELLVVISDGERDVLARSLQPQGVVVEGDAARLVAAYPGVDFAVMEDEDGIAQSVISRELTAEQLSGALHLSQLTLNACQRGTRRLLPVLMLEGRPRVLLGYRPDSGKPQATEWALDGGGVTEWVPTQVLLQRFKRSGALYGATRLDGNAGGGSDAVVTPFKPEG